MKISSDISLYEANFNANPQDLSSSESFRFSFRIWSPQFTAESHDRLWASLQEALPAFQKYGGWGGADAAKNSEVLDIYIEGHGDYCKYLVDMFQAGGSPADLEWVCLPGTSSLSIHPCAREFATGSQGF